MLVAGVLTILGQQPAKAGSMVSRSNAALNAPPTGAFHVTVNAPGHPPIRLYGEAAGRGRPLILLHGLGGSGYAFRKIAPTLARHYRVITLDLKGHGRSEKPFDNNYSAHDQAVLVYWFLHQAGLTRVALAGHSFGGQVAMRLAVMLERYDTGRIARLILMNAPLYPQPLTAAIRALRKPVLPYVALTLIPKELPILLALMSETVGMTDLITDADITVYSQPYADAGARHALIQTARQIVPPDTDRLIARYPRIRKPTLLVYCRRDQAVPLATGRRLARVLPAARLRVLEGCDHMPMEQRPRALTRTIRRFLK